MRKVSLILIFLLSFTLPSVQAAVGDIDTYAGTNGESGGFSGDDNAATDAQLYNPEDIAFDSTGNRYIADSNNHRIRKVTPEGVITTFSGTGTPGFSGDGGAADEARLRSPASIAIDTNNNLYIADFNNHLIRKIDLTSNIITTIAGTVNEAGEAGNAGFSGDGGNATAAQLDSPSRIAIDASNNLYIADRNNHRIRKINLISNIITTVAGNGAAGADGDGGSATSAQLNAPHGVAIDTDGNIFIADTGNNRIRKVDGNTGIISTIAGTGEFGFSGDGGTATNAKLAEPFDITLSAYGNLLISDTGNHRIRHLTLDNIITTIAGTGIAGFNGDGGQATNAALKNPAGISVDASNTLYIADYDNHRVRIVTLNTPPSATDNTVTASEDMTYSFKESDFGFNDADGHPLSHLKITELETIGTLKISGAEVMLNQTITRAMIPTLTFKSALNASGDNYDRFKFTVSDGFNNSRIANTITLNVAAVNDAPAISGTPASNVNEDSLYRFSPTTTDIDSSLDGITYSIINQPSWLGDFDTTSGVLSGTPDNSHVGTYNNIVITATDAEGDSSSLPAFNITVNNTNDAPTGGVTIIGTAMEDETLTAISLDIANGSTPLADDDGLGPLHYQWKRDGINSGINSHQYLLDDGDVGRNISVTVSYIDGGGNAESVTSPPTFSIGSVNDTPAGLVTISGLFFVGKTLLAVNTLSDDDGLGTFTYQWQRNGSNVGTNNSSYLLSTADIGQSIRVTINYIDGQGYPESQSSPATPAITNEPDLDGDGNGDSTDPDIDGDGMPNTFETTYGLDPRNANDAGLDLDGDGTTNLNEFLASPPTDPTKDDYPPTNITIPANLTINSSGLLTAVDLGLATAVDGKDGSINPLPDNNGPFPPGTHAITWTATDAAGNNATAAATQTVKIVPIVNFALDQVTEEGSTATVTAYLNGVATTSISVPFTLSGTATNPEDHDLLGGNITINANEVSGSITFNIIEDTTIENDETITLAMGTPTNAISGNKTTHTITITEQNIAPRIMLEISQGARPLTSIVTTDGGSVTATATVIDSNALPALDWSLSDNRLIEIDGSDTDATFTFNPSALSVGEYTIAVKVTDADGEFAIQKFLFRIVATAPALTAADSDSDGVDDATEGYGDSDRDGIADYLDAISLKHVVAHQQSNQSLYLAETQPGLTLRLGTIAFDAEINGLQVNKNIIKEFAGIRLPVDDHVNVGGLFDFEIHGLPQPGDSALIVIPLRTAIPTAPDYRKMMTTGWQYFIADANNRLASAQGDDGSCPPPGSSAYLTGLTAGHKCIQLQLEDGGPNDADGVADRVITDPGGVAVTPFATAETAEETVTPPVDEGTGSLHVMFLLLLSGLLWHQQRRKKLTV